MVRDELNSLLGITQNLERIVNQKVTSKNREKTIEEINEYLEKRAQLIKLITPPYSNEELRIGQRLVKVNKVIEKQLNNIFKQLKLEIKQMNKHKHSNKFYENPYESVQVMDGMFLDQKK